MHRHSSIKEECRSLSGVSFGVFADSMNMFLPGQTEILVDSKHTRKNGHKVEQSLRSKVGKIHQLHSPY